MNEVVPDDAPTNLVLPLSDTEEEGDAMSSSDDEFDELTAEVERETRCLFQDAHNAGFYINEYTTKVNVLGDKLLEGLRKAAEKQRDQMDAEAQEHSDKKITKAQQALQMLRKMVHLIARLQVKSGAEMAFPMLFLTLVSRLFFFDSSRLPDVVVHTVSSLPPSSHFCT